MQRTRWPIYNSYGAGRSTCRPSSTASRRSCRSMAPNTRRKPEERAMNQNEALLEKLSSWRPAEGRRSLHVAGDATGWAVALTVDRADQLGCLVWELDLRKNTRVTDNARKLGDWARRVANRATGLLESLKVVEIDATRGEALL